MSESALTPSSHVHADARRTPRAGWLARRSRQLVFRRLESLAVGRIVVREADGEFSFGGNAHSRLQAELVIDDPAFYSALALGGTLGAAESWIRGEWHSQHLATLVRILLHNQEAMSALEGGAAWLADPARRILHALRRNTHRGSRRNIAAHYDLGNDFFEAFLDPTLSYSSAVFSDAGMTLEGAQYAKYERLCQKLALRPDDHLLEIGTGWGGLALHAASRFGCRVTTTTISRAQYERASVRIARAGLSDRITLLFEDYRELRGNFDKLISIEMIEAVGHAYLDEYFRTCSERLVPSGRMALQAIVITEQFYESARRSVDFIKRYVFPGGHLPSVGAIASSMARATDLRFAHLEDLTPHYAETLRRWCEGFLAKHDDLRALGYDEPLLRLWEFYLRYCEGGFEARHIGLLQLVLDKPASRMTVPVSHSVADLPVSSA